MRTGTVICDRCETTAAEEYASQSGWVSFRIEPLAGGAYPYQRDLCAECAGIVLDFIG